MEKQNFLVILDTSELPQAMKFPRHVLNALVIRANDALEAKRIYLKMLGQIANMLEQHIWVYSLNDINKNLTAIDANGSGLPVFSHVPLNGSRPPMQTNKDLTGGYKKPTSPKEPEQKVKTEPQAPFRGQGSSRSQEFRPEDESPNVSEHLTKEQRDIINSLGVVKSSEGTNEGVNNRINSSVGRNMNINQIPQHVDAKLSSEQVELLQKLNVDVNPSNVLTEDQELENEIKQFRKTVEFSDEEYKAIDSSVKPIDEAEILRLQKELEQEQTEG